MAHKCIQLLIISSKNGHILHEVFLHCGLVEAKDVWPLTKKVTEMMKSQSFFNYLALFVRLTQEGQNQGKLNKFDMKSKIKIFEIVALSLSQSEF